MTVKEKIEKLIEESVEGTDFNVVTEIKAMLNSLYGEERNQIVKPSYETIKNRASEVGIDVSNIGTLAGLTPNQLRTYLTNYVPDGLSYQIIIHFPEITITNGSQEHLIRDIYVRLFLRPNGTLFSAIQGMRTTFTEAELLSQYVHSHLPKADFNSIIFNNFCTGIGEINQVLALLNSKFTSANFMMLLMHIKNFLEWESKEGHPYMLIENIFRRDTRRGSYNGVADYIVIKAADLIMTCIRNKLTVSEIMNKFTFTVSERNIVATATLDMEKWMAKEMENWDVETLFGHSWTPSNFVSLRDSEGRYHNLPAGVGRLVYQQGSILNFKDRNIELQIIERSQTQTYETFANPKITKETCKKLSRILTKTALTSAGIRSGSALVYSAGTPSSNHISV